MTLNPDERLIPGTKIKHRLSKRVFVFDRKGAMGENIFLGEDGKPLEIPCSNFCKYDVIVDAKQEELF